MEEKEMTVFVLFCFSPTLSYFNDMLFKYLDELSPMKTKESLVIS